MELKDLTMLTKYNFATRRFKENGNVYFDIVSTEEEKVYRVPEDLVKQILSGRKYKIVNLNLENGNVALKDTSKDLAIVKDINFYLDTFMEMNEPFVEFFFKLVEKKIKYIYRNVIPKYKDKLRVVERYVKAYDDEFIYFMTVKVKGDCKYNIKLQINENIMELYIEVLDRYGEVEAVIAEAKLNDYSCEHLNNLIENIMMNYL